jgi:uncharacterized protein Yka (UPF0111/DUF47 family)
VRAASKPDARMSSVAKRSNGSVGNLEQAMASLIQNQATFLSHLTETYQRLARIESDLDQIKTILLRHEQTLHELPEAIRLKIGFKSSPEAPRRSSS